MAQRSRARIRRVKRTLDDQTGHAARDTEGDELVPREAVDEKERQTAAAEGERDPAALVEELEVRVEAEARVEGGAVVVDDEDAAELHGAGGRDAGQRALAVAGFREHADVARGQALVDLHLLLDLDVLDGRFVGCVQLAQHGAGLLRAVVDQQPPRRFRHPV